MECRLLLTLFVCAMILSSCQKETDQERQQNPETNIAAIKASIDSLGAVVQKAHETRDDDLLGRTWAEDGILVIAGKAPVKGRAAIVSVLGQMPAPPTGGRMSIHPLEIEVLSPQWAYVLGIDSLRYTPAGGKEIIQTSTFSVLVKKTSEGWQSYRETLSSNQ